MNLNIILFQSKPMLNKGAASTLQKTTRDNVCNFYYYRIVLIQNDFNPFLMY